MIISLVLIDKFLTDMLYAFVIFDYREAGFLMKRKVMTLSHVHLMLCSCLLIRRVSSLDFVFPHLIYMTTVIKVNDKKIGCKSI